jgi:cellulose synthase/poly-beta-1,6-N-acetylglucosamine synthase-like glycosyltransferase
MPLLEWFFWLCLATVVYTYFVYPLLLAFLNLLVRREPVRGPVTLSVSFLLPVHNEESNLARRLEELTGLMRASDIKGEILVISDGSTDNSVAIARQFADRGVRVIEMTGKQGKAAALSAGAMAATCDLLIFADARQRWAEDALSRLVENFADPSIGAVSGDLVLETGSGVLAGVGLYWRFEKWLRKQESRLGSQVGVTGAISAVRRPLFHPIPSGTLLDDVFWPMHVVLQGYRVVHDERARAFDRLPDKTGDEFRRKVRTLAGNFQLLMRLPTTVLLPWRNRVWWQLISHKLLRLVVPWALIGMLAASCFLPGEGYRIFLWLQLAGYSLGLLGLFPALGNRVRILGAGASFLVLNAAAWLSFWVWITGRAGRSWHKAQYQSQAIDG